MAKLIYGMGQSLDGYIDDLESTFPMGMPDEGLFRYFITRTQGLSGSFMGRGIYEFMRYWHEDQPDWDDARREFAEAWRRIPKWVVSTTLDEVGPNTTLIRGDLEANVRRIKAEHEGRIDVAGPKLAGAFTELGLIDEYEVLLRPYVLGSGKPFFVGPRPPLKPVSMERVGDDSVLLVYEPA